MYLLLKRILLDKTGITNRHETTASITYLYLAENMTGVAIIRIVVWMLYIYRQLLI